MSATATLPALHPAHLEDLRKSGLTDETITAARLHTARPGDLPRLCGRPVPGGTTGLVVPYGDDGFARVRLFPPLRDGDGREVKYLQPSGSPVRAYFPPGVSEILADPSRSLCITEGEKKSLKLTLVVGSLNSDVKSSDSALKIYYFSSRLFASEEF